MRANRVLHQIRSVRADHHQLAMRHVDDAHHAEGDREPGGGEQQNRAEAQAVIRVLQPGPQAQMEIDRAHRALDRRRHGRGWPAATIESTRAPRCRRDRASVEIAASLSAFRARRSRPASAAARACCIVRLTEGPSPARSPRSARARLRGRADLKIESAAIWRAAASGEVSRSTPRAVSSVAADIVVETHGLQRAGFGGSRARRASVQAPSGALMNSAWSARANSRFSCIAARMGSACESPDAASASTPAWICAKLVEASWSAPGGWALAGRAARPRRRSVASASSRIRAPRTISSCSSRRTCRS